LSRVTDFFCEQLERTCSAIEKVLQTKLFSAFRVLDDSDENRGSLEVALASWDGQNDHSQDDFFQPLAQVHRLGP